MSNAMLRKSERLESDFLSMEHPMSLFVSLLFVLSLCAQESKRVNKGTEFVSELFEQFAEPSEIFR